MPPPTPISHLPSPTAQLPSPTARSAVACGQSLDTSPDAFGHVRSSADYLDQPKELNRRLEDDGYLYLPGFFDSSLIMEARASVCDRLAEEGLLDPSYPSIEGIAHPDRTSNFNREPARDNPAVKRVVYGPEIVSFYEQLFGEPIRHFDYTWFRAMSRGQGSAPHCDLVYMGRGTHQLLTGWVPYGDTSPEMGGLMLLEDSHKKSDRIKKYLEVDVDSYCTNRPRDIAKLSVDNGWSHPGYLSKNPVTLREKIGGRWLTAPDWKTGDFITFGMTLIHGGLDNQTDRLRISTDTRYQRASQPIDERWIGDDPMANRAVVKRGRIC